jgi:hypothetical protein
MLVFLMDLFQFELENAAALLIQAVFRKRAFFPPLAI